MAIWFHPNIQPAAIQALGNNTMGDHLGIVFTEIGDDYLKATMPVDHRTKQPYGLLHGGASAVLAETLGSLASHLVVDSSKFNCVGIEINANHLRGVREGLVTGIVKPLHTGKTTHVWDIKIYDSRDKLVCVSRLTVAIVPQPHLSHP
jgi:1,4-dihydroxy-2-naphthoyl-CoA hydrolase